MRFDGTDIDLDGVLHSTNLIGHGHETMNDQTARQFNANRLTGESAYAGRVGQAEMQTADLINSNHTSTIMPMREMAVDSLRRVTHINQDAQEVAASGLSQPAGGIGALINPGS